MQPPRRPVAPSVPPRAPSEPPSPVAVAAEVAVGRVARRPDAFGVVEVGSARLVAAAPREDAAPAGPERARWGRRRRRRRGGRGRLRARRGRRRPGLPPRSLSRALRAALWRGQGVAVPQGPRLVPPLLRVLLGVATEVHGFFLRPLLAGRPPFSLLELSSLEPRPQVPVVRVPCPPCRICLSVLGAIVTHG